MPSEYSCSHPVFECVLSTLYCFKQKTAYEMRISDWSSDVCSSDLTAFAVGAAQCLGERGMPDSIRQRCFAILADAFDEVVGRRNLVYVAVVQASKAEDESKDQIGRAHV